jgi:hypothetical protein
MGKPGICSVKIDNEGVAFFSQRLDFQSDKYFIKSFGKFGSSSVQVRCFLGMMLRLLAVPRRMFRRKYRFLASITVRENKCRCRVSQARITIRDACPRLPLFNLPFGHTATLGHFGR